MATLAQGAAASPRKASPLPVEVDDVPSKPLGGRRQHWGYHLILDISGCNHAIDDPAKVKAFLAELVAALKMKTLAPPVVVRVKGEDGRGVTAVQLITTSSITFHGDDDRWCAYIDVFSCKPFAPKTALDLVRTYFQPKHVGKLWLFRDAGRWPER